MFSKLTVTKVNVGTVGVVLKLCCHCPHCLHVSNILFFTGKLILSSMKTQYFIGNLSFLLPGLNFQTFNLENWVCQNGMSNFILLFSASFNEV